MQTIRVSLPGYNALTDSNIDHFALYADSNNILIKEKTRGNVNVDASSTYSVSHGLSYIPLFMVYAQDGNYRYWVFGESIYSGFGTYANSSNIYLKNYTSASKNFRYYIFYDQQA